MDYRRIHDSIILKAINENRVKNIEKYYELHHIIPKCLGGDNSKNNLVLLTAKEHYIVHRILIELYPNKNCLVFAFWTMVGRTSKNQKRFKCSAKSYEYAKNLFSTIQSDKWRNNNPNNHRNLKGENNPMFGSKREGKENPFYGKNHSKESKEKISQKNKGKTGFHNIRKVIIDNIIYLSLTEASKTLEIPISTLFKRINNEKFKNYNYENKLEIKR